MMDFQPENCRSVLIVKLRHLGDVLLTSPVASVLKNHLPGVEIDALVYAGTEAMLAGHPAIRDVLAIDRAWKTQGVATQLREEWRLLQRLRSRRYDLVIHLTEHPRGAWLSRVLRPRWAVGIRHRKANDFWKGSFTHLVLPAANESRHTVEKHLDALRVLGIHPEPGERTMQFAWPAADGEAIARKMAELGLEAGRFVVLHPASRWKFKCASETALARSVELFAAAGRRVVLTAGLDAQEVEAARRIAQMSGGAAIADLAGKLSLKQLGALIARAAVFVGVDSAPMHMAAAVGTPTVALFGPTSARNWGPWAVPHRVLYSARHSCVPCGADGCGGSKISDCLMQLSAEDVAAAGLALADGRGEA